MSVDTGFDPRTGAPAASIPHTTPDELDSSVAAVAACAESVGLSAPSERRRWLAAGADALERHREALVRDADWETGLGVTRLDSEVARTAGQLRFYGEVAADGGYLDAVVDPATDTLPMIARVNRPLGPVAVFGASNFPFAFSVFGTDTASAIAAGCPVVVKAHPAHPLTSQRTFEVVYGAMIDAGAPEGVATLVHGYDAGAALVEHPAIAAVAFTGSQAGGLSLWRAANARDVVIPVFAEMGTVNPVVVTPAGATRMTDIARGFVDSFTLGSGQFCTKPGLLLVPRGLDAEQAVATALAEAAPQPLMLTRYIAEAVGSGVRELKRSGARVVAETTSADAGWSSPATVLAAPIDLIQPGHRVLEECFGPVAVVVEYDDIQAVIQAIGSLQGALAASLMTSADRDPDADALLAHLERKVGRVIENGWPTGVAVNWAQQHGGPWPATTHPATTSVGAGALTRFVRPVAYQGVSTERLPNALRPDNPWQITRRVDGKIEPAGSR